MLKQEAYYDLLVKYRDELTRPIQEAMDFMRRIETQLNMINNGPVRIFTSGTFFLLISFSNSSNIVDLFSVLIHDLLLLFFFLLNLKFNWSVLELEFLKLLVGV